MVETFKGASATMGPLSVIMELEALIPIEGRSSILLVAIDTVLPYCMSYPFPLVCDFPRDAAEIVVEMVEQLPESFVVAIKEIHVSHTVSTHNRVRTAETGRTLR
jgi:hypothetical protein